MREFRCKIFHRNTSANTINEQRLGVWEPIQTWWSNKDFVSVYVFLLLLQYDVAMYSCPASLVHRRSQSLEGHGNSEHAMYMMFNEKASRKMMCLTLRSPQQSRCDKLPDQGWSKGRLSLHGILLPSRTGSNPADRSAEQAKTTCNPPMVALQPVPAVLLSRRRYRSKLMRSGLEISAPDSEWSRGVFESCAETTRRPFGCCAPYNSGGLLPHGRCCRRLFVTLLRYSTYRSYKLISPRKAPQVQTPQPSHLPDDQPTTDACTRVPSIPPASGE